MPVMRAAVVGHIEWMEFVPVEAVPRPGEIVHADESWEQAAGGGSVAAVQLSKLADSSTSPRSATTSTPSARGARGPRDHRARDCGRRSPAQRLHVRRRRRRADDRRKLHPRGHDDTLPWHELARCDAVYLCAGDADALLMARRARPRRTARELATLKQGSVELDALVSSGKDEAERYQPGQLDPDPRLVVTTSGKLGGWAQPGEVP